MTITLPPLLELLGIIFGGLACGYIAFAFTAFFAVMNMDGNWGERLAIAVWPVALLGAVAGWYLLGRMA